MSEHPFHTAEARWFLAGSEKSKDYSTKEKPLMGKTLKWIGIIFGGLIVVLLVAGVWLYAAGRSRLARTYNIEPAAIAIPDDEASLARGRHLATAVSACGECHGEGLRGKAFFDDPALGTVVAANLTSGEGGIGGSYSDEDWLRAIRHGVGPDARPLLVMSSQRFQHMNAEDLGALVAYLKAVVSVDNAPPETNLAPLTYILIALGQFNHLLPAEYIDHGAPLPHAPAEGATQAYGQYLVSIATCRDCHGEALAGGQAGPGEPIGPNLTPGGELVRWDESDFMTLMRTGQTPDGRQVDPFMPWHYYHHMSDDELTAIWLYLQSLPTLESQAPESVSSLWKPI
jgi:mono/diheme cytochrome c family protein